MTERKIFTEVNAQGETVKVSKKEIFKRMLEEKAVQENELYRELIEHEINLLERKNANRQVSGKTAENEILAEQLYQLMLKSNAETTIAEILQTKEFGIDKGYNSPKIVVLMKILSNQGKIEKRIVSRKTYYKAIEI